jgi:hypothetical protein
MNTAMRIFVMASLAGCAGGGSGEDPEPIAGDLVDDLEDGDDAILDEGGRKGGWYTFNDMTDGMQEPPGTGFVPSPGGAGDSAYAAGTSGGGFTEWGAGMGFDLNNPEAVGETGERGAYDASRYAGLAFQARGDADVRVALETLGVTPMDRGGTCTPSMTEGQECEDVHGVLIELTDEWREIQIPFAQLRQGGWGKPVPFAAAEVTAVLFMVAQGQDFEFAVDDVRLYE